MSLLSTVRKAVIAVVGLAGTAVSANLVPDRYAPWVSGAVAVLTAAGVYTVPNAAKSSTPKLTDRQRLAAIEQAVGKLLEAQAASTLATPVTPTGPPPNSQFTTIPGPPTPTP